MFNILVFGLISGVFSRRVRGYSQRIRVYDDHIFDAHLLFHIPSYSKGLHYKSCEIQVSDLDRQRWISVKG